MHVSVGVLKMKSDKKTTPCPRTAVEGVVRSETLDYQMIKTVPSIPVTFSMPVPLR